MHISDFWQGVIAAVVVLEVLSFIASVGRKAREERNSVQSLFLQSYFRNSSRR